MVPAQRAHQEHQNERPEEYAAEDLGPARKAEEPGEGKGKSAEDRGQARRAQLAAEPVREQCAEQVQVNVIEVQHREGDVAGGVAAEQVEGPVEGISCADDLAEERLAAPQVGIPEGE